MADPVDGAYKELHLSSYDMQRTSGTRNHPIWEFTQPIYADKFMIKNCQVPLTWYNIPKQEIFSIRYQQVEVPANDTTWFYRIEKGNWNTDLLIAELNRQANAAKNEVDGVTDYSTIWTGGWINLSVPPWTYKDIDVNPDPLNPVLAIGINAGNLNFWRGTQLNRVTFDFTNAPATSRLFGYPPAGTYNTGQFVVVNKFDSYGKQTWTPQYFWPGPVLIQDSTHLFLRSSLTTHAGYAVSTQNDKSGVQSASILGKIPLDPTSDPMYTAHSYANPVGTDTMFNLNSSPINKMDMWFTKENEDEEVDFNSFHFTVTLGFWTRSLTANQ